MSFILDFCLFMDPLASLPSFYIDGHKEYYTFFGSFLTSMVYIITVGCTFYFAQELWNK